MKSAKINVSEDELELMLNKEWLFQKRRIIEKVYEFFSVLHDEYNLIATEKKSTLSYLPVNRMGKISRGENLGGLPYLVLDYPALFSKKKIIAIRTLFWWGNFFSISLHLSGLDVQPEGTMPWLRYFKDHQFSINASGNEWNQEFNEGSFESFNRDFVVYANTIAGNGIFRVAYNASLTNWPEAQKVLIDGFEKIITFLEVNFPGDETGPLPGFPKADSHL